jgi:hypothetical protein
MDRLPELKDKTLGCWCKPEKCHGDVLAEIPNLLQRGIQKLKIFNGSFIRLFALKNERMVVI